ncbi:glycosyltransferase [Bifidobacterium aquikefiricola]|uniref:Glycosyltransferase n=1 Tax=Bifidobacterium aquikefiricola TaxID=3059038 RepID=A0AB39U4Y4_9BIFI
MPENILVFGVHDKIGGVETYFYNVFNTIYNIHFDFVSSSPTMCYEDEFRKNGSTVYKVPDFHRKPLAYYKKICAILEKTSYDAIYYNMLSAANILPIVAARRNGISRIIAHSHNAGTPSKFIKMPLNLVNRKLVNRFSTDKWACSTEAAEFIFGTQQSFTLVPNAIDTKRFTFNANARQTMRNRLGISDELLVGFVGRFTKQKNPRRVLDIFRSFHSLNSNSKLVLTGSGELESELKKEVQKLGLESSVIFTGNVRAVESILNAMDMLLLPSLFEGLPIVLLEAQACGLPYIASNTVSQESIVTEHTQYLSLDSNDSCWANHVQKIENTERESDSELFARSKWTLKNQTPLLQQLLEKSK